MKLWISKNLTFFYKISVTNTFFRGFVNNSQLCDNLNIKLEDLPNEEVEAPEVSIDELRDAFQKAGFYDKVDKNPEPRQRHRTKLNPEQRGVLHDSIKKAEEEKKGANKKVRINGPRAERVAPGIFGQKEDNEIMQKDMDALFRAMPPTKLQNKNKPATLIETKLK